MSSTPKDVLATQAPLGLWDVVSIMIGIVVGTGIYEVPPLVLRNTSDAWQAIAVWALCGGLCFMGALCLAELASTYPHSGGDYVYLTRSFGPGMGFMFAWYQLTAVRAANIAMMAFVFADYAASIWNVPSGRTHLIAQVVAAQGLALPSAGAPGFPQVVVASSVASLDAPAPDVPFAWQWLWASAAIGVLALLNLLGVVFGKGTQNVLTVAKVLGLGGILVAGFGWPQAPAAVEAPAAMSASSLATALVVVFLAYGGWNDAVFVAAEVRGGPRAIARALLVGTAAITLLYVLINAAFLWGLGFERARQSRAVAADLLAGPLGEGGKRAMALLVMISALGAINGMLFSGARVYARMGADHPVLGWLGLRSVRTRTPWGALVAQAIISLAMVGVVGTEGGRSLVNDSLAWVRQTTNDLLAHAGSEARLSLPPVKWEGHGGFEILMVFMTPVFWVFFFFTALSLFVLRRRDPDLARPFAAPLYPLLPLLFCAICGYMIYAGIRYALSLDLLGGLLAVVGLLAVAGLVLYRISQRMGKRNRSEPAA
jgi:amino acid transporter